MGMHGSSRRSKKSREEKSSRKPSRRSDDEVHGSSRRTSRKPSRRSDDEVLGSESESDSVRGSLKRIKRREITEEERKKNRKEKSSRRRSRSDDEDSEEERKKNRKEKSSRRRSRRSDDEDSESESESDNIGASRKRIKPRKITDEEITEYLAKKAQKKALKVAKQLKSQTVSGYSNDSNPFGDSSLNEKFVWRKKIERDVTQGAGLDMFSVKAEKKRQKERMAEIEKVKKRREEREIERAQREEEMQMLARERARAEFYDWEKKAEEFHFDQSKIRSEIRLREGRTKPIDILSKNLNGSDDFDIELNEPYMVFKGLTVKEMEELRDDIKMHLEMDRATPTHIKFWEVIPFPCPCPY